MFCRLDKYCSNLGWFKRNYAKNIIKKQVFFVNWERIQDAAHKVSLWDSIMWESEKWKMLVEVKEYVYLVLNKPAGYICADVDQHWRKSYRALLVDYPYNHLLHVAWRLDQDTEWLVILTNDWDFIHKVIHPKKNTVKEYSVKLEKNISDLDMSNLEKWVTLEDWYLTKPSQCIRISDNEIILKISEWKFHQVKRMLESVNNKVSHLKRLSIWWLHIDLLWKELWKEYNLEEISNLVF